MKTEDLEGAALDYWVAKAGGSAIVTEVFGLTEDELTFGLWVECGGSDCYSPSTRWEYGGPIIEAEKIILVPKMNEWRAADWKALPKVREFIGSTPLIAAMRCVVASKFGDEVE